MTHEFLSGATCMGCLVVALFLFNFWRRTRDRLFLFFATAFLLLASETLLFIGATGQSESEAYYYITRLVAFTLIIIGVVDKNRRK